MSKELYQNGGGSYLAAAVASGDATLTVQSGGGASFPSTGNFRIKLGAEIMLCTARSTDVLTVTRGQEGTTAAAWALGNIVFHLLTDQSLRNLCRQDKNGTNIAARREVNFVEGESVALTLADDGTNDKVDVQIDVKLHTFAGAPTGTPANGTLAYDSTNNKLYVYFGSWRGITLT